MTDRQPRQPILARSNAELGGALFTQDGRLARLPESPNEIAQVAAAFPELLHRERRLGGLQHAQPRSSDVSATFEEVAKGVNTLTQAVQDMKKNLVDRETVERIARDVFEQALERGAGQQRRGLSGPPDLASESSYRPQVQIAPGGSQRWLDLTVNAPAAVAQAARIDPELVQRFQQASDRVVLLQHFAGGADGFADVRETDYFRGEYLPLAQALSTGSSGGGADWVPTVLSGALIERVNLDLMVLDLFPVIEMPSNPFQITGLGVTRLNTGSIAENTADTGQTGAKKISAATRKVTLTAMKFMAEMLVSKELEEDAIIPMLPTMESEIVDYLRADLENTAVNGDTAGAQDTKASFYASDDPLLNWDGLRKRVQSAAKTDGGDAALTAAMLRTNRKKLGKYGVRPSELAHLIGPANYMQLLGDTAVQTLDKYGPNATILTGELAKVDGVPVILSEYMRQDANASGVVDGTTTNRSMALTVNRRGYFRGLRRGITVQVLRELYAEYDQDGIVVSTRQAFESRFPTSELTVAETYNLSIA